MMHGLKVPDQFTRLGAQRYHGIRVKVVPRTLATVVVRTGARGGNEYEIAFAIHRYDGPCIRATHRRGNRIPGPKKFSASGIEGAYLTADGVGSHVVRDCRTDDDPIANHGWRRRLLVLRFKLGRISQPYTQVDQPIISEVATG